MKIHEEYQFVTVWEKNRFGINEKCTITDAGYVGNKTGKTYPFEAYYHSPQYIAKVKSIDEYNKTALLHLDKEWNDDNEENNQSMKAKWVDKELIVEAAHWVGSRRIYRSVYPIKEYWSDLELEVNETSENRIR